MSERHIVASRRVAALLFALSLVPLASAQTKIKAGWNLFSPQDDVQIGQQSAVQAQQQLPMLNDSQVNAYVNRIGQRLARNAGGPGFNYQFHVVNASDINAFALPGGFIYVNRGVLDQARNEGEVAGVLAHEISHVALRHGTHQASKAYAAQAGISILGGLLGGHLGQGTSEVINAVGGLGLNALFLKYSRDLESQADIRGAQILAASGYSPQDMVGFFHTLESVDTSRKTNWMSDHPAPPDRIARIQREASLLHVSNTPTTNVAELNSIKSDLRRYGAAPTSQQIAQGMTSSGGTSSRRRSTQNATIGGVSAPSGSFASYTARSGVFRIAYPSNWRVYSQSSTGAVIAPEGGVLSNGRQTDIVYGAVINHYDPFNNSGSYLQGGSGVVSLDQATNDLLGQIHNDSPYLRIAGSGQRLRVSGGRALAVTLRGVDPSTNVDERVTLVTRQLSDEHLLYVLFIVPEREASRYDGVLNQMVSSMEVDPNRRH
jgi:Zn-dependent protease with chaperone function